MNKTDIIINDVTLRDGLQSLDKFIDTKKKVELANLIIDTNITHLEITSFVSPKAVEQFKDSSSLASSSYLKNAYFSALVPNLKGFSNINGTNTRINEIVLFVSACELHNFKNIGKTINDTLSEFKKILAENTTFKVRGAISMVFGSPFTGCLPEEKKFFEIMEFFSKNSVDEVTLCDTWGKADQKTFNTQLFKILQNFNMNFSVHLHNINGKAMKNFEVAIEQGIRKFDTVFGATGGCPFSLEAGINLNIRDAMNVISKKGFTTNLNQTNFLKVENYLSKITGGKNYEL